MPLTLVLGGTSSGKSAHAEALAAATGLPVRYVATAADTDASMADRIARHRARRPAGWETVIAGADLAAMLGDTHTLTLIDGLGVWIATNHEHAIAAEIERLIEAATTRTLIVVAEQAGEGLLPMDAISRRWLDQLGRATQALAAVADRVDHVIAGRVLTLPPAPAPATAQPVAAQPGRDPQQLRHHGDRDVVAGEADHAVNVLDGGPPAWLAADLQRALTHDVQRYPDERPAQRVLGAHHRRAADEVLITNGASQALWLLGQALRPSLAALLQPAFTETELGLRAAGVQIAHVLRDPQAGFALDPAAVPAAASLVVVTNPASPDGTLYSRDQLLALRAPGRTLVIDEAFMGLLPDEPETLAGLPLDDVIVVRSLTKLLSVPGLRVGYLLAPDVLAARLGALQPPWSANSLALATLVSAAEHPDECRALADRAVAEGADLQAQLAAALPQVRRWPSATNFVLIEVPDGVALQAQLHAHGIAVRSAAGFRGLDHRHVRLTARDPDRNAQLVATLVRLLAAGPRC